MIMKELNIGRILIENRHKRGITQEDLAEYMGVSKASVSKWETATTYPDITLLPRLASYFNISIDEFIGYEPQILFSDEPTSGLDPKSAQNVHAMIRSLANEHGITVFLCTHQLRYAQEICTRYGLMAKGRLIAEGTLESLRASVCPGITLKLKARGIPSHLPCRKTEDMTYEADIRDESEIPGLVRQIVESGGEIYHVSAKFPSLEDIYFSLTRNQDNLYL